MPTVRVSFGNPDLETVFRCWRCQGTGKSETFYDSGVLETCPSCDGSGHDPNPSGIYAYRVAGEPQIGDKVEVPASTFYPAREATIVAFGPGNYDGPLRGARPIEPVKETP